MRKTLFAVAAAGLLGGCATGPYSHPDDPLEPINRAIYAFNDGLDDAVIKPVSKAYKAITPDPVDRGVTNFFNNIGDVAVAVNDLLQFKIEKGLDDLSRVMINSTFGLLGVLDVASEAGIAKRNEDFGQTLGHWGMKTGPYLVLPFFGPNDVRDGVGLVVDWHLSPIRTINPESDYWATIILNTIDKRADLIATSNVLDEIALDPYETLRDSYLQRRAYLVSDGKMRTEEGVDLFYEDDLLLDVPAKKPAPGSDKAE